MAPTELTPLPEGQMEIMNLVWERGEVTVADVWKELSGRRKIARNTVQTTMVRLEEKGWLAHRAVGPVFLYKARRPKRATLRTMMRKMVDTLFEGSAEELVTALLDGRELSKDEADRIRDMIAKAEGKP